MTGGVIVATVLQTAPPGSTEGRLHYDADCRLIIPAGQMHSPLRRRPSGTNLPLHHLQAPAPPQTPQQPALTSLWQRRLCAPPLSRLDWWLIGGLIDYDSCVCPLRFRPSVSAMAGSSFVNIRACVREKLLCILSGQQLAVRVSGGRKTALALTLCHHIQCWWATALLLNDCQMVGFGIFFSNMTRIMLNLKQPAATPNPKMTSPPTDDSLYPHFGQVDIFSLFGNYYVITLKYLLSQIILKF